MAITASMGSMPESEEAVPGDDPDTSDTAGPVVSQTVRSIRPSSWMSDSEYRKSGGAPDSYADLLHRYSGLVMKLATQMGIPQDDREDALSEVILRFWQKGGLSLYDPQRLFEEPKGGWRDKKSGARTAKFTPYFKQFAFLNLLAIRDKHRTRQKHLVVSELARDDAPLVLAPDTADVVAPALATESFVERSRALLADDPVLVQVFDHIVLLALSGHEVSVARLNRDLSISRARAATALETIRARVGTLRTLLVA